MSRTADAGYRRNRARLKRTSDVCAICGQWIDPDLVWPHPGAWTADHVKEIRKGGHNRGELQAAHWACNLGRNRKQHQEPRHSRTW